MPRYVKVELEKRGTSCTAVLLDGEAPRTCQAVWNALPLGGDAFHAKYARNEVYTLVPPFAAQEPGPENPTVTPIPGDLCYFSIPAGNFDRAYRVQQGIDHLELIIDLAIFYGRNNLLLNADTGWVPGTVFGSVVSGLEEMAAACQDVWRSGGVGEHLTFSRAEAP
ncbi:MAG: DUF3830 family protein [Actinomycetota bacterium]|nr:DUF3830 family protein [Actinomycetota bacterium]